jgi:hypothetical protein
MLPHRIACGQEFPVQGWFSNLRFNAISDPAQSK